MNIFLCQKGLRFDVGLLLPVSAFAFTEPVDPPEKMSAMKPLNRRAALSTLASATLASASLFAIRPLSAQTPNVPDAAFGFENVIRRARELAALNYEPSSTKLPDTLQNLSYDDWRDIRYRPEKSLFSTKDSPFRLQLFHLGHLYKQPVVINLIRDGIAAPIPYTSNLFDYGHNAFAKPFPVNLGFAGFRLHTALNQPNLFDELIAFLGASYFRLLGRGQHYGLSARGLALANGTDMEEFPVFREFWIETPVAGADHATLYALLDSPSCSGAYRFDIYPGVESFVEVTANIFPRKTLTHVGLAPLTSMFFTGASDPRNTEDYRPQLHDSDGLLIHSGTGEWIWRPLRNPHHPENSAFVDKDIRGFGLMQRDRSFEHYQDLDLAYELRPSYWIEPHDGWGEGSVQLVEFATENETNDNIVASWSPKDALEAGKSLTYGYRMTALTNDARLTPGGRAINTFRTAPRALGAVEALAPGATRFLIDFAGGDLGYYLGDTTLVQIVATTSAGNVLRTFLAPNSHVRGFRAGVDVAIEPGQSCDVRVFLKSGNKALTETWTFPWRPQ